MAPLRVLIPAFMVSELRRAFEIATSGRRDPTQGTIRFRVKVALDDPDPRPHHGSSGSWTRACSTSSAAMKASISG